MIVTVVDPRPTMNVRVADDGSTINVGTTSTKTIIVTAAGPQGPAGIVTNAGYTHTQNTASTVWTIHHKLGYAVIPVVLDEFGTVTFGWRPAWSDLNTLILTFPVAFKGTAHVS